jgi:hypothetical protein
VPGQVRDRVACPPELGELRQRLTAVADRCCGAESLGPLEFLVKRRGVAFATHEPGARPTLLVAPAHPPYRSARVEFVIVGTS